ncbi:hypothetical protein BIZ83_gp009 [Erwinia phage vB_EamM_ChrisDB]|uniref:hypothetical protein n=1 Tax=Erwinia phage vB_EamM_ChrisDB TaxID=1883371 RepID=UPI00081CE036|nr:hypothetical protein BIZ83_gp009 [Erwinia phage vB_EamM_ChrisDB]ANZ48844.1 hypothetical protein CHRISDB_282 [Erwinia phage vB_EamM_ChrisDB]
MTELYYLAVVILWIALFMCIRHMYGVVIDHATKNNISRMATRRSLTFVVGCMMMFGSAATYGMSHVYTLHQLSVL